MNQLILEYNRTTPSRAPVATRVLPPTNDTTPIPIIGSLSDPVNTVETLDDENDDEDNDEEDSATAEPSPVATHVFPSCVMFIFLMGAVVNRNTSTLVNNKTKYERNEKKKRGKRYVKVEQKNEHPKQGCDLIQYHQPLSSFHSN